MNWFKTTELYSCATRHFASQNASLPHVETRDSGCRDVAGARPFAAAQCQSATNARLIRSPPAPLAGGIAPRFASPHDRLMKMLRFALRSTISLAGQAAPFSGFAEKRRSEFADCTRTEHDRFDRTTPFRRRAAASLPLSSFPSSVDSLRRKQLWLKALSNPSMAIGKSAARRRPARARAMRPVAKRCRRGPAKHQSGRHRPQDGGRKEQAFARHRAARRAACPRGSG